MNCLALLRLCLACVLFIGCAEEVVTRDARMGPSSRMKLSIGGLRPGMTLADARHLKPDLLSPSDWGYAETHGHSMWSVSDDLVIVSLDFDDGKVSMVYGLQMQMGDVLLRDGDSLERVRALLGPPEQVLDIDKSPDRLLTYYYPTLALSVSVDRKQRTISGGFALGFTPENQE